MTETRENIAKEFPLPWSMRLMPSKDHYGIFDANEKWVIGLAAIVGDTAIQRHLVRSTNAVPHLIDALTKICGTIENIEGIESETVTAAREVVAAAISLMEISTP